MSYIFQESNVELTNVKCAGSLMAYLLLLKSKMCFACTLYISNFLNKNKVAINIRKLRLKKYIAMFLVHFIYNVNAKIYRPYFFHCLPTPTLRPGTKICKQAKCLYNLKRILLPSTVALMPH